jgi:D-arabinose 1-dehydrogenase-like Zn-dependent alcohol dehydrogenase
LGTPISKTSGFGFFAAWAPAVLSLVAERKLQLFANNAFPLTEVKSAFKALSSRRTIGRVVLNP